MTSTTTPTTSTTTPTTRRSVGKRAAAALLGLTILLGGATAASASSGGPQPTLDRSTVKVSYLNQISRPRPTTTIPPNLVYTRCVLDINGDPYCP